MRSTHASLYLVFADIYVVNNLRSFERSELERKWAIICTDLKLFEARSRMEDVPTLTPCGSPTLLFFQFALTVPSSSVNAFLKIDMVLAKWSYAPINVMPEGVGGRGPRNEVRTSNVRANPTWGILANFEHTCCPPERGPITHTSVTFRPSLRHVCGLWLVDFDPICR